MKTPITFEKEDILKIIYVFLKKKGFRIPGPEKVVYKGALQVTINVDYDLEVAEIESTLAPSGEVLPVVPAVPVVPDVEPEPDLAEVLGKSKVLKSAPALYPGKEDPEVNHRLMRGESEEWPK